MVEPPTGTVTFLFTDIEGSTRMWERNPEVMQAALLRHDEILHKAIELRGGHVFKTVGDAFCAAFADASEALGAALASQHALLDEFEGGVFFVALNAPAVAEICTRLDGLPLAIELAAAREATGVPWLPEERAMIEAHIEAARIRLEEWEKGRSMTLDQAVGYALEGVGDLAIEQG